MENKKNTINRTGYISPAIMQMEMHTEGIMAVTSGNTEWYEQGGQGNFSYTVETDDSWK